jgi:hypothetical protein
MIRGVAKYIIIAVLVGAAALSGLYAIGAFRPAPNEYVYYIGSPYGWLLGAGALLSVLFVNSWRRRRLKVFVLGISAFMTLACVTVWVRSYPGELWAWSHNVMTERGPEARGWGMQTAQGGIRVGFTRLSMLPQKQLDTKARVHWRRTHSNLYPFFAISPNPWPNRWWNRLGFQWVRDPWGPPTAASDQTGWYLVVPCWLPTAMLLLLTVWQGRSIALAVRRARRISRGMCPRCGYDLRASSDRCPECGDFVTHSSRPCDL